MADDQALAVQFDDGSAMTVSLRPEDNPLSEAGHYRASSHPGEPLVDF